MTLSGDSLFVRQPASGQFQKFSYASFTNAVAFSLDPFGRLYVLDAGTNQLYQISPEGETVRKIGGYGWSELAFDRPADLSTPNGLDVYVADYGNHRVQRFDQNFNFISTLYLRENENASERFGYPAGIAVSGHGDLFLSDGENSRIVKIVNNTTFDKAFGGIDAGNGRLQHPSKIRLSPEDQVYVQDGNSVKVFDVFGNYLRTFGEGMFGNLHSFRIDRDVFGVLDSSSVRFFGMNNDLLQTIDLSEIQSGDERQSARDFIFSDTSLYVLTAQTLYILDLSDLFNR